PRLVPTTPPFRNGCGGNRPHSSWHGSFLILSGRRPCPPSGFSALNLAVDKEPFAIDGSLITSSHLFLPCPPRRGLRQPDSFCPWQVWRPGLLRSRCGRTRCLSARPCRYWCSLAARVCIALWLSGSASSC